jgi:hypothetical protein
MTALSAQEMITLDKTSRMDSKIWLYSLNWKRTKEEMVICLISRYDLRIPLVEFEKTM